MASQRLQRSETPQDGANGDLRKQFVEARD
jgi:hypothetical protein